MFLSTSESTWVGFQLRRELYRMRRPEVSDLLAHAGFEVQGRELWIAIPGMHDDALTPVVSAALLNSGLPFDGAVLL